MTTDKNIDHLILNRLTKEQYEAIEEPNPDELYFVPDDESIEVVQETGQSTTAVMSQKAVTDIVGDIETAINEIRGVE